MALFPPEIMLLLTQLQLPEKKIHKQPKQLVCHLLSDFNIGDWTIAAGGRQWEEKLGTEVGKS